MEKWFKFSDENLDMIEASCIPFIIYQVKNQKLFTLTISDGLCRLMRMSRRELMALSIDNKFLNFHPDDVVRVASLLYNFTTQGGEYDAVYRYKIPCEDGYSVMHAHGRCFSADDEVNLAVIWYVKEDIRENNGLIEQKLSNKISGMLNEESMIRGNYYDSLTNLPNMFYFLRLAEFGKKQISMTGKTTAFLYFDLSGMKSFNEANGLREGDKLLCAVAEVLAKHYSKKNCSRLGQDHFAAFVESENLEVKLKVVLEELKTVNNGKNLPVRVGIYLDQFEKIDASTACDRAKIACDQDKHVFESKFFYYSEQLRIDSLNREYILHNFDRALEENWIHAFYQPIVRGVNRRVCNEESLARWIDPHRGVIMPKDFVPILEETKLIYKLDLYMVDRILEDLKRKKDDGIQVAPVSINLSRSDFEMCDVVNEICKKVDASGISRDMLIVEITEGVVGIDIEFIKSQIHAFHSKGFKVWMDDFGSGYSSLNILQEFNFDLIKFDMKFMRDFEKSKKSHIILTELVQMANKLGIDTLVEGVETEEQFRFLRDIGCDKIQGYYFSKPNPLSIILERYRIGVGIGFEPEDSRDYYERISKVNLNDPSIYNEVQCNTNDYFNGLPMGIFEYRNGEYYLLRYNKNYVDFLVRTNFIDNDSIFKREIVLNKSPEKHFCEGVEKCIKSGKWEAITNSKEESIGGEIMINSFVRKIAVNKVSGGVACIIVIFSIL